jgi:GH25 family lysozyme M1 (1,4-beta-N-acetylmuramidase)
MEQVTFIIEHKKDKNLLITLAEKLGIKKYVVAEEKKVVKKQKRVELLKIINAGTDVSNFGNPSEWQKEARKDRTFNQI